MHYKRWRRNGNPEKRQVLRGEPLEVRFWSKVNFDGPIPDYAPHLGPCWLWTGTSLKGYGKFNVTGETIAHRIAYRLLIGSIPAGLELDHLCGARICVNGWHLEPVTNPINLSRSTTWNGTKTHCKRGHPLIPGNLIHSTRGARICRACRHDRYWQRKAQRAA